MRGVERVKRMDRIPRLLHAVWVGPLSPPWKLLHTWPEKNPGWECRLWTDADFKTYSVMRDGGVHLSREPWKNREFILRMQELNGKADMMRFEILLEHGGIAVDADEECLRPLDDFPLLDSPYKRGFREHEAWAAYENETCRPELVAMGALGAAPGASVFEELVVGVANQDFRAPAWISVGPWYLTKAARRHPELF